MNRLKQLRNLLFAIFVLHFFYVEASGVSEQMSLAKKAFVQNQFDKAVKHLDFVLKDNPNYSEAYSLRGKCKLELDLYNEALDNFQYAHNQKPQESEFLYYKGLCEWKLKRVSSAIQSLEKSLVYNPGNFLAYNMLGYIYFELEILPLAKANFDKALDIQPDFSINVFNKNKMEEFANDYKVSLRAMNREVKRDPKDFRPLFYKGLLKAIAGDNWGAYMDFTECAKLNSSYNLLYFYKAYVEYKIKKFEPSLQDLHTYSKKNPNDASIKALMDIIKEITNIKIIVGDDEEGEVLMVAEQMPEFKGGVSAMYQFLASNLKYPPIAASESIEGKVVVSFIIDSKGYVGNIQIAKPIGGGCEEEAIRVINMMPRWNPGKQNAKPVSVRYTLPVTFKLNSEY